MRYLHLCKNKLPSGPEIEPALRHGKMEVLINEEIARYGPANGNQWLYIAYQRNGESDCEPISINFHKVIIRQEEV